MKAKTITFTIKKEELLKGASGHSRPSFRCGVWAKGARKQKNVERKILKEWD